MMAALMLKLDCAGLFVDYGGKPRFRVAVVVFWPWGSPVSVRSLAEIFRMLQKSWRFSAPPHHPSSSHCMSLKFCGHEFTAPNWNQPEVLLVPAYREYCRDIWAQLDSDEIHPVWRCCLLQEIGDAERRCGVCCCRECSQCSGILEDRQIHQLEEVLVDEGIKVLWFLDAGPRCAR